MPLRVCSLLLALVLLVVFGSPCHLVNASRLRSKPGVNGIDFNSNDGPGRALSDNQPTNRQRGSPRRVRQLPSSKYSRVPTEEERRIRWERSHRPHWAWHTRHMPEEATQCWEAQQRSIEAKWRARKLPSDHVATVPEAFVMGTPKSGTTAFFTVVFRGSPAYAEPVTKELKFFNTAKKDQCAHRTDTEYLSLFPLFDLPEEERKGKITGEGTPIALLFPCYRERIKQLSPNAKAVVVLRDPLERLIAEWRFHSRREFRPSIATERVRLDMALNRLHEELQAGKNVSWLLHTDTRASWYNLDLKSTYHSTPTPFRPMPGWGDVLKSFYLPQIRELEHALGSENVLIVQAERFFANRTDVLRQVDQFFGVDPNMRSAEGTESIKNSKSQHHHMGAFLPPPDEKDLDWARRIYRPAMAELYSYLDSKPHLTGGVPFTPYPWTLKGASAIDPQLLKRYDSTCPAGAVNGLQE